MLAAPELQTLPPDELLQQVVPSLVQLKSGASEPERFTIQQIEVGGVPDELVNCLRFAASILDQGDPAAEDEILVLEVRSRYCIHPDDRRMLIGVSYSERRRQESEPVVDLENEGEEWLQSLSFTPLPKPGGRLVFSSNRDEANNYEIYTVDVETGDLVRLTDSPRFDGAPSWSPDGTQIVFQSGRLNQPATSSQQELFVMNVDGSGVQQLTSSGPNFCPSWSPDGSAVAFHSTRDGNEELYVKDLSSGEERKVTDNPSHDTCPSWSPDGGQLAFTSRLDQTNARAALFVVNVDGSGLKQITDPLGETSSAWSPDGKQIAFRCHLGVCIESLQDGSQKPILPFFGVPAWSPDGSYLALMRRPSSLIIYSPRGVRLQEVTLPPGSIELPQIQDDRISWAPQ